MNQMRKPKFSLTFFVFSAKKNRYYRFPNSCQQNGGTKDDTFHRSITLSKQTVNNLPKFMCVLETPVCVTLFKLVDMAVYTCMNSLDLNES